MCEYNFLYQSSVYKRRLFQEFQLHSKSTKRVRQFHYYVAEHTLNILLILNICLHYTIVLPIVLIHCIWLPLQSRLVDISLLFFVAVFGGIPAHSDVWGVCWRRENPHIPRWKQTEFLSYAQPFYTICTYTIWNFAFPGMFENKWCREMKERITQDIEAECECETNELCLSVKCGKLSFDLSSFMAQIKEYPIQRTLGAQTYECLYRMALEKVGYILYDVWRYDNEAISESEWQAIKRRSPPPQKTQLYSEPCPFRINCKFGLKCHNKHTEDEKRFFRTNQGEGNPLRKVKPCLFHPNCKKEMKECHYAHGEEDAWCLSCRDMCGHYTQNCPQLKKSQDDD